MWLACLVPALLLVADALRGALGANPVERVSHETGIWGLRLLLATLAVTPLRRLTRLRGLAPYRRVLGLSAFGYACLHVLTYLLLDLGLDLGAAWEDVLKRPYITAGAAAFALLIPLAVTSPRAMVRRLGRHWVSLHRLVYPAAVLGVLHLAWQTRADPGRLLVYASVLALLLGARVWHHWEAVAPAGIARLGRGTGLTRR